MSSHPSVSASKSIVLFYLEVLKFYYYFIVGGGNFFYIAKQHLWILVNLHLYSVDISKELEAVTS
jgi:hypothetical protein